MMQSKVLFFVLTISLILGYIQCCGMITHNEVSQRALFSFQPQSTTQYDYRTMLNNNQPYLQAGSVFPDSGYLCKTEYGELTHWPPYISSLIEYITEKYEPGSKKWEQLTTFLFGITSHDYADIGWHWGRQTGKTDDQGYLHTMSHTASDCKDVWNSGNPSCHTIGDTGADLYLAYRGNLGYIEPIWTVPAEDLAEVYRTKIGLTNVTKLEVGGCLYVMYVGAQLEKIAAGPFFDIYGKHSAYLTEDLDLWFVGGLDDMATNVMWKWNKIIEQLEGKKSNSTSEQKEIRRDGLFPLMFDVPKMEKYAKMLGVSLDTIEDGNIQISQKLPLPDVQILKELVEDMKSLFNETSNEGPDYEQNIVNSNFANIKNLVSNHDYSYFGKSITTGDFNGDGKEEAYFGAPGYSLSGFSQQGAIYYFALDNQDYQIQFDTPSHKGEAPFSRFGWALSTADLNHDGIDDLIVSAPSSSKDGSATDLNDYYPKSHNGRVYIYYGSKTGIQSYPSLTIVSDSFNDVFFQMGISLNGKQDCNNDGKEDLIIGQPFAQQGGDQRGHIAVVTDLSQIPLGSTVDISQISYFQVQGSTDYQWFGYSSQCGNNKLYIGAPGSRQVNTNQASGAVFIYDLETKQQISKIYENDSQSKFGSSISLNDNLLAVGAPSKTVDGKLQSGQVLVYELTTLKSLGSEIQNTQNKFVISCNQKHSRFGKAVRFLDENVLIVGSSQFSSLITKEEGRIFTYSGVKDFSGSNDYYLKSQQTFSNGERGARFGETIFTTKDKKNLLIGEPFRNQDKSRIAGSVNIFDIKSQVEENQKPQKFLEE